MNASSEPILMKVSSRAGNTGENTANHVPSLWTLLTHARRGKSGGQVRDEYREEFDPGRGGYGRAYDEKDDKMRY
jgi:hypothetical protein